MAKWSGWVNLRATVIALLCSRYRPERHYMRGPGPKWRQKQAHERRCLIIDSRA